MEWWNKHIFLSDKYTSGVSLKESISHNPLTENISPVFSFSDARHRLKMAWTLPSFNSDGAKPRCVAMISFAFAISPTTQAPLKGPAAQIITLYLSYMIWGCTHCVFADEINEKFFWNNRHGRISIPTEERTPIRSGRGHPAAWAASTGHSRRKLFDLKMCASPCFLQGECNLLCCWCGYLLQACRSQPACLRMERKQILQITDQLN